MNPRVPMRLVYVTEYAGKDISEDLAETWVSFVICDKPYYDIFSPLYKKGSRASRRPRVTEKVTHMWTSPALVAHRSHVRTEIGEDILRNIDHHFRDYCLW